ALDFCVCQGADRGKQKLSPRAQDLRTERTDSLVPRALHDQLGSNLQQRFGRAHPIDPSFELVTLMFRSRAAAQYRSDLHLLLAFAQQANELAPDGAKPDDCNAQGSLHSWVPASRPASSQTR